VDEAPLTIPPTVVNEGREGANAMATTLRLADWRNLDGATEIVPPHPISDDVLVALGVRYEPLRFERFADGTLLVTPPAGTRSSGANAELVRQVAQWNHERGDGGYVTESSGGVRFPDGAVLAPDATYWSAEHWRFDSHRTFADVVPDAAFEALSSSDSLISARKKLAAYLRNGVALAVLVDPKRRRMFVGRAGASTVTELPLIHPLDCTPAMPGFVLDVAGIVALAT
jgi:Uma2 family endonuclease